jgi:invasion protein IalB
MPDAEKASGIRRLFASFSRSNLTPMMDRSLGGVSTIQWMEPDVLKSLMRNGAISSFGIAVGIVAALLASAALAETAPPAADQKAPPAPAPAPSQWIKVCDPQNAAICQITEDYSLAGTNTLIGSVSIQTTPDANKFAVGIQVPLGFLLQAGIPLSIDGTKQATAQFITCVPSPQSRAYFCLAQLLTDGGFIDSLKKGKNLQLALFAMDKTSTTLDFPLTNFTDAFNGPDQAALARQREDAAKILAEKAKERAKQLEGQQPKP